MLPDEPIRRAGLEDADVENGQVDTAGEEGTGMNWERASMYIHSFLP